MNAPKTAIIMVRRDEAGQLHVVDGRGADQVVATDADLRKAIDGILDDPNMPQAEQVANVEYAAEQIFVQTAASLLPEVARPLAAPLVRDAAQILRKVAAGLPTKIQRTPSEPTHTRKARARSARLRNFRQRTGPMRGRGAA
ncbi:MAG: hypothetical protein Q8Q14_10695 [Gemmatimonadales bacterium]|nr:hypothetical protein [Gemmatimonadales bacterium]